MEIQKTISGNVAIREVDSLRERILNLLEDPEASNMAARRRAHSMYRMGLTRVPGVQAVIQYAMVNRPDRSHLGGVSTKAEWIANLREGGEEYGRD